MIISFLSSRGQAGDCSDWSFVFVTTLSDLCPLLICAQVQVTCSCIPLQTVCLFCLFKILWYPLTEWLYMVVVFFSAQTKHFSYPVWHFYIYTFFTVFVIGVDPETPFSFVLFCSTSHHLPIDYNALWKCVQSMLENTPNQLLLQQNTNLNVSAPLLSFFLKVPLSHKSIFQYYFCCCCYWCCKQDHSNITQQKKIM